MNDENELEDIDPQHLITPDELADLRDRAIDMSHYLEDKEFDWWVDKFITFAQLADELGAVLYRIMRDYEKAETREEDSKEQENLEVWRTYLSTLKNLEDFGKPGNG